VPRFYKQGELAVGVSEWVRELLRFSCCEKLVVEAGDSSEAQRKGNVRRWKPLTNNDSEDVIVDTSVGEIANCNV
jgi:hypothetical protein